MSTRVLVLTVAVAAGIAVVAALRPYAPPSPPRPPSPPVAATSTAAALPRAGLVEPVGSARAGGDRGGPAGVETRGAARPARSAPAAFSLEPPAATPAPEAAAPVVAGAPEIAAAPSPDPGPSAEAPAAETSAAAPGPAAPEPAGNTVGPATGAMRGRLRAAGGAPLAGVRVLALAVDGADAAEDVTDAEGRFLLVGLRPGRYAVFAGLGTPVASRVGARGATVEAGAVTGLALAERGAGARVRVRALDAEGRETATQAVLVPASAGAPAGLGAVLACDAILLPGATRNVVESVPPGRYTVVLLQGETGIQAPLQVEVAGKSDLDVEVHVPPGVAVTTL
jgi:hypothetical protein